MIKHTSIIKRIGLIFVFLLVFTTPAQAQISEVGSGNGTSGTIFNDGTETVTITAATANNLIVVWVFSGNSTQNLDISGFTSAISNNANGFLEIFYKVSTGGETNITVTATVTGGGGQFGRIWVSEFSGTATSTPLDATNTGTSINATSHPSGDVTTTTTHGLLVVIHDVNDTLTLDTDFTNKSNDGVGLIMAYDIVTSTGTYNSTSTTSAPGDDGVGIIAAFKGASAGGGSVIRLPLLGVGGN